MEKGWALQRGLFARIANVSLTRATDRVDVDPASPVVKVSTSCSVRRIHTPITMVAGYTGLPNVAPTK